MIQRIGCIIFASVLLLVVVPVFGVDETVSTREQDQAIDEPYFWQGKPEDTIFKYEKKSRKTLLQMKGSGSNQSHADEDEGVFGLETLFGQLLFRDRGGYDGFYFLSGGAALQACTPYGLIKTGYQDTQAAEIASGNYELGGLDFYYRHINYPYSDNEEIIGVAFTVDLCDPGSSFDRACPRLFSPHNDHCDSVAQMSHIGKLAADEFTAKPRVQVVYTDLLRVDKINLPSNVSVDPDNSRLIVETGCDRRGLQSSNPQSASSAFSAGGGWL